MTTITKKKKSPVFEALEIEISAQLPTIREIGTKANDKEFKALGIAIESALQAPVIGEFKYPHDLNKSLMAYMEKKDDIERASAKAFIKKIKEKLMRWAKDSSLSPVEKTVVTLILALIDAFRNNNFTRSVNLLFQTANKSAFKKV